VVVVADDLDESAWKSYAIADNRASDLSEWDTGILAELAGDGVEVGDWFTPEEMAGWDVEGSQKWDKYADVDDLDIKSAADELNEQFNKDGKEKESVICPHCGGEFLHG